MEEMAMTGWSASEIDAFLDMQFRAQHTYYQDQFKEAVFQVIQLKETDIGRLYLDYRTAEIRIIDIALLPEFRGQGIGRCILKNIVREAARTALKVGIHVEKNNPALQLYYALGFQVIEDGDVYLNMEAEPGSITESL